MISDPLSPQERSERMSRIKSADTKPEMVVRKLIFHSGFRYRLHVNDLPGKPDLVFKSRKKIIFVHGCFWHQHECGHYKMPHSNLDYWLLKLQRNVERDKKNIELLKNNGWSILIVWECEIKKVDIIMGKILLFLNDSKSDS